jgi:hypothetical protein
MPKIISEFRAGKYRALTLDHMNVFKDYTHYVIEGKTYPAVPVYDLPDTIAIETADNGSLVGKSVEFK